MMFLLIISPTISSETSFFALLLGQLLTSAPGLEIDGKIGIRQNVCSQESFREKYLPNSLIEVGLRCMLKGADEVTCELKGWHLHSDEERNIGSLVCIFENDSRQKRSSGENTKRAISKNCGPV